MRNIFGKTEFTLREISIMTGVPLRNVRWRAKKGWLGAIQPMGTGRTSKYIVTLDNLRAYYPDTWTDLIARLELGRSAERLIEADDEG